MAVFQDWSRFPNTAVAVYLILERFPTVKIKTLIASGKTERHLQVKLYKLCQKMNALVVDPNVPDDYAELFMLAVQELFPSLSLRQQNRVLTKGAVR